MGTFRYNLLATVILAAVFLGRRASFVTTAVVSLTALLGGFLIQQNIITPNPVSVAALLNGELWLQEIIRFTTLTAILIGISFQLIYESELTFNRQQKLTQKLAQERQTLGSRIEERTRALRLTAEVSRTLVMILDKDQLVLEVVEQIQKTFNYYHVHIYLLDKENEQLLMAGGTGEAGKALLIGKHRLPIGKGLVGRAALMGIPILVGDVSTDKYWLPNPLLPETRSEIAVPIIHENKVIGVLDVQDDAPNSLTEQDVDLLETLGNQLGVALTNADLYQQRTEQALRQAKLNEISNRIQFSADIPSAVQVAVREIGETLRVNRTSILLQPEKQSSGKSVPQEEAA
jgi:putative methionine-R-sulfoxide reductase with GAF domain